MREKTESVSLRSIARCLGRAGGILLIPILLSIRGEAAEWQPVVTTDDGIAIFKKENDNRGLIEFRGVGVVDAPLPLVATVIFNTRRRTEWVSGLAESRILRWQGKDRYIEYDRIDMPLFFSERDFVTAVRLEFDHAGNDLVFRYRSTDDPDAPRSGSVRGEVINLTFLLRAVEDGRKTKLDASFLCDPKGWIPVWLVNFFLSDWPAQTFRNLRREVQRPDISVDRRISGLLQRGAIRVHEPQTEEKQSVPGP